MSSTNLQESTSSSSSPSTSPSPTHSTTTTTTTATHLTSHTLTPTLTRHTFALTPPVPWQPTQHIELLLPPDLDPTGTTASLSSSARRLLFTPCNSPPPLKEPPTSHLRQTGPSTAGESATGPPAPAIHLLDRVEFLAGSGRITALLGLPRFTPLVAEVVGVGGGFARSAIPDPGITSSGVLCDERRLAVAGGSGIAPFVALGAGWRLVWSLRSVDVELVRAMDMSGWREVRVFVTGVESGREGEGRIRRVMDGVVSGHEGMEVRFGRVTGEDLELGRVEELFFCGGRALEWQVRMWALKTGTKVVTTEK